MRLTAWLIAALVAVPAVARAYPQLQLALGAERCGACHLSPAGGGLLNDFGRDEAGGSLSAAGDGRFLHGFWQPPSWLALGGDVRLAAGDKQLSGRNERLAFPMQLDAAARVAIGPVSVDLTAGVRGGAREPSPPILDRLASREHFIAYERDTAYVRAGRFFPVFGLRLADHTAYVRRFLGFGLLEEPYGVELAYLGDDAEARVTAFTPPPIAFLGAGYRARGVASTYERRLAGDTALAGGQLRAAVSPDEARYTIGAFGKLWSARSKWLWLGELDVQRQTFHGAAGRTQLAAYVGATRFLARGWQVTAAAHVWDPDLTLRRDRRDAVEIDLQYFPLAHVELHLLTRAADQGNQLDDPGLLSLLQLHYYL